MSIPPQWSTAEAHARPVLYAAAAEGYLRDCIVVEDRDWRQSRSRRTDKVVCGRRHRRPAYTGAQSIISDMDMRCRRFDRTLQNAHDFTQNVLRFSRFRPGGRSHRPDLRRLLDSISRPGPQSVLDYQLLVFRDQNLTKDEQVAFTEQFGTLERHAVRTEARPIIRSCILSAISTKAANRWARSAPTNGTPTNRFDRNRPWRPSHAQTLPPDGGDTVFVNMYAAFDGLNQATKDKICALTSCIPGRHHANTKGAR